MDEVDLRGLTEEDKKIIFQVIKAFKRKSYLEKAVKELSKCLGGE